MITIFTDGSSRGNPGPGGWGAIIADAATVREIGGRAEHTTNNRMELEAVIEALDSALEYFVHEGDKTITIHTDSSYVKKGATQWLSGWQTNGWKTKGAGGKKDILNRDLWEMLAESMARATEAGVHVGWKLLAGHVGIPGNERCDGIATAFADGGGAQTYLYHGPRAAYTTDLTKISGDVLLKKEKSGSRTHARATAYSYVSMVGGKILTHKTWAECEARVKGTKGARYKKATSAEMEKEIIAEFSRGK